MSRCNYCTLQDLRRQYKGQKVTTKKLTGEWAGWVGVFVGDRQIDVYFKELGKRCEC